MQIITGFLGSGKTTLLNHILTQKHGKRVAIIENEFGEVGIDNELIVAREDLNGTELTILENGCLCCAVLDDLATALIGLYERKDKFDHIVIETTGLANPAPIISTFFLDQRLRELVRLDGVCTVVDAKHVTKHLDAAEPQYASDASTHQGKLSNGAQPAEPKSNEAIEQLGYADRIVLNKRDLVNNDELAELKERIRAMNAMATMHTTEKAVVPVDYVLGIGGFALQEVSKQVEQNLIYHSSEDHSHSHEQGHGHEHDHAHAHSHEDSGHHHGHDHRHEHDHGHSHGEHGHGHSHSHGDDSHAHSHDHSHAHHKNVHDDAVKSASFVIDGDMDLDKVNFWLGALVQHRGDDIYRMKGILSVQDHAERFVFQGVHNMFEGSPERPWKDGEQRQSKMVFIGKDLDFDLLREGFEDCVAEAS